MKFPYKLFLPVPAIFVCALVVAAFAQKPAFPAYVGHVNDFADAIDPATEQRLETILTNFENLTGAQIAAVVVPSLNDRPIEDYAEELYDTWGIGAKSGPNKNKGALLLISLGDRKTRLEVGYGLEGDLPDGLAGEIIRRMRPDLQQGQYSQALEVGVRSIVDTLAEKWNVDIAGIDRKFAYRAPARPEPVSGTSIFIMMGLFLLFIIFMSIIARKARRSAPVSRGRRGLGAEDLWWMAPIIFNRSGGDFGGGSWGSNSGWGDRDSGSSSGGSDWGGFGGGDSGGGGASDSW